MSNELIICQPLSRKNLVGWLYVLQVAFDATGLQNWKPHLLRICFLYKPAIHLPLENCELNYSLL